jgi:hypothetical protein
MVNVVACSVPLLHGAAWCRYDVQAGLYAMASRWLMWWRVLYPSYMVRRGADMMHELSFTLEGLVTGMALEGSLSCMYHLVPGQVVLLGKALPTEAT